MLDTVIGFIAGAIKLSSSFLAWIQRCAQDMLTNISPAIQSGLASKLNIQAFVRLEEAVLGAVVQLRFDDVILAGIWQNRCLNTLALHFHKINEMCLL